MKNMSEIENEYYAKIYRKCMRASKYNLNRALEYVEHNYTGENRTAFNHKCDSPSWMLTQELRLYNLIRVMIRNKTQSPMAVL